MKNLAAKRNTILLLALAAVAAAQTVPGAKPAIGQKMKQNAEALKHYTYKRRTEIEVKGKSRGTRVDLVRYVDGKMETVPLETPSRPAQSSRGGGLRGRMVQKKIASKKEKMKEDVERLKSLLRSYSPGSDSMRAVLEKAVISRTGPEPNADIKVVTTGLAKPSDSFTLIWSVTNHRPAQIEIGADLDGKPVRITVEFAALPDGTFYAAHTVVSTPKKDINITMDTFDYTPSSGASSS
jgi:hypothetical protein